MPARPIALSVLAVSCVAFVGSAAEMARRIADFNQNSLADMPFFQPVIDTEFTFGGTPVSFVTNEANQNEPESVEVTFGNKQIELFQTIPGGVAELEDLTRHRDWLRVFRFALARGMTVDEVEAAINNDTIDDRLAIIIRIPPPGADSSTWGEVWAKHWKFDIYELTEAGDIVHERLAYPKRKRGEEPREGELVEGTWQYHAALLTMPPMRGPKPRFGNDAVNNFGWTYAGVGFSAIGAAVSGAFLFAPRRRDETEAETENPYASQPAKT